MKKTSSPDISAERIARDITAAILSHRLPPGTRLREEALARAYGVSRTKVRAALLMLTKDKLACTVPEKGAFVSKPSAKEAREIFAVRRILEVAMAREFVARARPEDFIKLEEHLSQERAALLGHDVRLRSKLLVDFHVRLAEIAGNSVLTEMLGELSARSAIITMLYQSVPDAKCSSDEHHAFLVAAKRGDTERACALMNEHLAHVEQALQFAPGDASSAGHDLVAALLT